MTTTTANNQGGPPDKGTSLFLCLDCGQPMMTWGDRLQTTYKCFRCTLEVNKFFNAKAIFYRGVRLPEGFLLAGKKQRETT